MTARLAAGIAGFDLGTNLRPPPEPLAPDEWSALRSTVRAQRLDGPLVHAAAEGWLPTTSSQLAEAADAHQAAMATVLVLDRALAALARQLADAGVAWRSLKGAALAHLDEPDASLRAYGDVDVLVGAEDIDRTLALLIGSGGRRHYPEPSPGFDRRFGKGAAVTLPHHVQVDVHRTLALGPFGVALDPADLFASEETFQLAGATIPALDRPTRFLHACYHAVLGQDPPRLVALRDVVRTLPVGEDSHRAHQLACRWRGEAVLATALVDASTTLATATEHPLVRWAHDVRPVRRDRRWLGAYRGPQRSSSARTLLSVEALPDLRSRLAYAAMVLRGRRTSTIGRA